MKKLPKFIESHYKCILIRQGHRIDTQMVFDTRIFELGL